MLLSVLLALSQAPTLLIDGGTLIDGSGRPGYTADVRIAGALIAEVGQLAPRPGEDVVDARGLVVSPGFIDAHSHADGALDRLESQLRQGITTAVCGQDGSRPASVREQKLRTANAAIRFEFFSGHGGLRSAAMRGSTNRKAIPSEIRAMRELLRSDMQSGALGLSTGLEYDPGHHASTLELISLAQVSGEHGGMYISHVRDESAGALDSIREVLRIGREAGVRAQVSHIKLGVASVWGKADEALRLPDSQPGVTADLYPYTYWQSTIRVLTPGRDYDNRQTWVAALADVGGPGNVRLTTYTPNAAWVGKTLQQLMQETGRDGPELIQEIVRTTSDGKGRESVLVTAMSEADVIRFMRHPKVMFCSDGSGGSSHPRGAGSFPRVLGTYVRERKVLSLHEAVRKMTSLPASTFGLSDRGLVRKGLSADLVLFDPATIRDRATPEDPTALSVGVKAVFVRGKKVL